MSSIKHPRRSNMIVSCPRHFQQSNSLVRIATLHFILHLPSFCCILNMFVKLSVFVFLTSIAYGAMGASVAVNVTDAETSDRNMTLPNSTMAVNASDNNLKARQVDLLQLNVSDVSLNSTTNATHSNSSSLMDTRSSGNERIVLGSSTSLNSTDVKLSMELNSTAANISKADNLTTRAATGEGSHSESNSTNNGTANPWSALPLFRNLNSSLHNSSLRNSSDSFNSSHTTREIESPKNSTDSGVAESLFDDEKSSNGTEKADHLSDDSSDSEDDEDDGKGSTKKPCTTVSCFISRGCGDTSCSQEDN